MDEGASNEPIFRASKRRKVFRRRDASDDDTVSESHDRGALISNHPADLDDNDAAASVRVQVVKPGSRKHGIGFTSTERRTREGEEENGETALVLTRDDTKDVPAGDRFVRPTGRVAVTEDRHMMAYVDSKLAEARSVTPLARTTDEDFVSASPDPDTQLADEASATVLDGSGRESSSQRAQTKSTQTPQRPIKRRRRGPPVRAEEDIARDSMIDQIMHEAQVPLYAQPASATTTTAGDEDNDAAAADAFKAQLLAEMEMQNRRRRPAKAAAAAKDAKVSTGPKLGGSRSQRERMKAMEEAKAGKK